MNRAHRQTVRRRAMGAILRDWDIRRSGVRTIVQAATAKRAVHGGWAPIRSYVITYGCMSGVASEPLVAVGGRVRGLREAMSLSLRDLAERSGVSAPMLSQVERGETSPTLTVAARIAGGLELSLSQLLRLDEGGDVTVVRAAERRRGGNPRRGHRFEVLTSSQPG